MDEMLNEIPTCSVCGTDGGALVEGSHNFLLQSPNGKYICYECYKKFQRAVDEVKNLPGAEYLLLDEDEGMDMFAEEETPFHEDIKITPKDLKDMLDEYVIGQDRAKKVLSTVVHNHISIVNKKRAGYEEFNEVSKSSMILVGPSGSGKSELIKRLANSINVPFVIEDITKFSSTGLF